MKNWLDVFADGKRTAVTWAWALLRRPARYLYWTFVGEAHRICGTRLWEPRWSRRGIEEVRKGFSNVNHPHRELLIKQFEVLYPFTSVLEVGCGYGPNVQLLAAKFPDIEVWGIDINPTSVREGNRRLAEMRIEHARLIVAKADDLSQFADRSFDIVFTDAMLQYIGPEKIRRVIGEMKRISRRALLVVELHQDDEGGDPMGLGFFTPDGWVRDCRKLLKSFSSDDSITLTKIPTDVWPERPWVNLGWIITVVCCRGEGR